MLDIFETKIAWKYDFQKIKNNSPKQSIEAFKRNSRNSGISILQVLKNVIREEGAPIREEELSLAHAEQTCHQREGGLQIYANFPKISENTKFESIFLEIRSLSKFSWKIVHF